MTVYLLFILIILCLWHLFWEALIAPNLRLLLRYKLFTFRDELRRMHMVNPQSIPKEAFDIVDRGLSSQIKYASAYHFSDLVRMKKAYDTNPEVKKFIHQSEDIFQHWDHPEISKIRHDSASVTLWMVVVNSGAWIIYLVPIVGITIGWKTFCSIIRRLSFSSQPELSLQSALA